MCVYTLLTSINNREGGHVHIFMVTNRKNDRFQKNLIMKKTDVHEYVLPLLLSSLWRHWSMLHALLLHVRRMFLRAI